MEKLLSHEAAAPLIAAYGREALKLALRRLLPKAPDLSAPALLARAQERLSERLEEEPRRVINATGVLIHTNLGRSPLSASAREAIARAASGYAALEMDLASGRRGSRGARLSGILAEILACEDALVVNNNAAAVLLALAALARGREVLVSRGELVAIGGSFKIPEILEASGARLREAGTTNRTKIEDYARAMTRDVAALLTVHPSNYEIRGYVKRAPFSEIGSFCRRRRIPWIHDLGSGNLADLSPYGISGEETAGQAVAAGASLVCFSGDKLFGGPQAGILAGKRKLVAACRAHPLARAVRADKLTLAGLFATARAWLAGRREELPVYAMAAVPVAELARRAEALAAALPPGLTGEVIATRSVFGGGTTPEKSFPSAGLALRATGISAEELSARLRRACPPVVGRIEGGRLILDLRAVAPEEDALLSAALAG